MGVPVWTKWPRPLAAIRSHARRGWTPGRVSPYKRFVNLSRRLLSLAPLLALSACGKSESKPELTWHSIEALGVQIQFPADGSLSDGAMGDKYLSRKGRKCQLNLTSQPHPMELAMRVDQLEQAKKPSNVLKNITNKEALPNGWSISYSFINHREKEIFATQVQLSSGEKHVRCENLEESQSDTACGAAACRSMKAL